jgi:hypothetical protein
MTQEESISQSTTDSPQKQHMSSSPVVLDYQDLLSGQDLTTLISEAFGLDGLGVLLVKNVPNLLPLRKRLLVLASEFAKLSINEKEACTHAESKYSFGWFVKFGANIIEGRMVKRL